MFIANAKLTNFRLNGSKAVLIERVAHAFYGLPAGRQNEVNVQPPEWHFCFKTKKVTKVILLQRFHSE